MYMYMYIHVYSYYTCNTSVTREYSIHDSYIGTCSYYMYMYIHVILQAYITCMYM